MRECQNEVACGQESITTIFQQNSQRTRLLKWGQDRNQPQTLPPEAGNQGRAGASEYQIPVMKKEKDKLQL